MRRTFLDPDRQAAFERRGYAVLRLFSAGEAAAISDALEAMRAAAAGGTEAGADYDLSFTAPDLAYRRQVHDFLCRTLGPRLEPILDDYLPLIGSFLTKPPGAGDTRLHCDWTWTAGPADVTVNVWCPLVDVDEATGALRLVAGSQRLVRHVAAPHARIYCAGYAEAVKARATPMKLKAGEAVIFESSMLHWAAAHASGGNRPAVSLSCLPREARPVFYRLDHDSRTPRFELLDMSGGAWFDHGIEELDAGNLPRPSLGFVPNPNRLLAQAEFDRLLAKRGFARGGEAGGLFARAKALLSRVE